MQWLRRLLRRRRDPHSLDPVRPMVKPEDRAVAALERRIAQLDYEPESPFLRDQQQRRAP